MDLYYAGPKLSYINSDCQGCRNQKGKREYECNFRFISKNANLCPCVRCIVRPMCKLSCTKFQRAYIDVLDSKVVTRESI
jgi:hypothetical protein